MQIYKQQFSGFNSVLDFSEQGLIRFISSLFFSEQRLNPEFGVGLVLTSLTL